MEDYINKFKTFDEFFAWLESPEEDVVNGRSNDLMQKQAIKRASIEVTRRNAKGKTLEARNKAMEKIGYKERMKMVYEEVTNGSS